MRPVHTNFRDFASSHAPHTQIEQNPRNLPYNVPNAFGLTLTLSAYVSTKCKPHKIFRRDWRSFTSVANSLYQNSIKLLEVGVLPLEERGDW